MVILSPSEKPDDEAFLAKYRQMREKGPQIGDTIFVYDVQITDIKDGVAICGNKFVDLKRLELSMKFETRQLGWGVKPLVV